MDKIKNDLEWTFKLYALTLVLPLTLFIHEFNLEI
jgi:hypothetical protein